jgi:hypothetical protein
MPSPGGQGLLPARGRRDPVQHWAKGSEGTKELAHQGRRDSSKAVQAPTRHCTKTSLGLFEKIETIAKTIYRADDGDCRQDRARPAEAVGRAGATATCRSAWPRRSIPSPPIPTARRADGLRHPGARGAPVRRRRLRGRHLRRDHDHAGPAKKACRIGNHLPQRRRARSRACSDQVGAPAGIWSAVIRTGGSRGFA